MTPPEWTRLRDAVLARDFPLAAQLLADHPELPTLRNRIGETVLHFLAVEDDRDGVAWLHRHGFSLDARNAFGVPVVFEVAQLEYRMLFRWFREQGADLAVVDDDGQTLREFLTSHGLTAMVDFVSSPEGHE